MTTRLHDWRSGLRALPLFVLFTALSLSRAVGGSWVDPDFAGMVAGAELIAVVTVTASDTPLTCRAKVDSVLKGRAPDGELAVSGFNDRFSLGIEARALRVGDRAVLFLHRNPKGGWQTPTPSCGVFRYDAKGRIRGDSLNATRADRNPGVEASLVLTLLRGYLGGEGRSAARALIGQELTVAALNAVKHGDEESNRAAQRLRWLLCAQGAYGSAIAPEVVLAAANHRLPTVQVAASLCVHALPPSPEAVEAIGSLLLCMAPPAQDRGVDYLLKHRFEPPQIVEILRPALSGGGPRTTISPSLLRLVDHFGLAGALEDELLALLTPQALEQPDLFQALAAHVRKHPSPAAREVIAQLYVDAPQNLADYTTRTLLKDPCEPFFRAIAKKVLNNRLPDYSRSTILEAFAEGAPADRVRETVWKVLELYPAQPRTAAACARFLATEGPKSRARAIDAIFSANLDPYTLGSTVNAMVLAMPDDAALLEPLVLRTLKALAGTSGVACAIAASLKPATPAIHAAVLALPRDGLNDSTHKLLRLTLDGISLKLNPPAEGKLRVERWLAVIKAEKDLGYARAYVCDALLDATPDELVPYALQGFRAVIEAPPTTHRLDVVYIETTLALGGTPKPDEQAWYAQQKKQ